MTTRTVSPTVVRDEALQSVKDHIEDVYCQLPVDGAQMSAERVTGARRATDRLLLSLVRLAEAQERVDACQCPDPTPHQASADAAAAVLASPTLRERLGRAPLASDRMLP